MIPSNRGGLAGEVFQRDWSAELKSKVLPCLAEGAVRAGQRGHLVLPAVLFIQLFLVFLVIVIRRPDSRVNFREPADEDRGIHQAAFQVLRPNRHHVGRCIPVTAYKRVLCQGRILLTGQILSEHLRKCKAYFEIFSSIM